MTADAEIMHDGVIGCDTILVFLCLERVDKDSVRVIMLGSHDLLVPTARADRETTGVIGVQFRDWIHPDMHLIGSLGWEWTHIFGSESSRRRRRCFRESPTIDEF